MVRTKQLIYIAAICILFAGCKKEFGPDPKYDRPSWLAGKIYTQIKDQPALAEFARCLELTGYDTIINISGSYTVFAPDSDAFDMYFQEHPSYSSVEDIPLAELTRLVKYHIVQNPWSLDQLRQLDVYGWIDTNDIANDEPRGYKRETLLREKDRKFGVIKNLDRSYNIVDTLLTVNYRRQATDARKYAPLFYREYFDIYHLNSADYSFYFNRDFQNPNDICYLNGRIVKGDIFAENGFIHIIDRVVEPLQNAYQILETKKNGNSYTDFLNLVNQFPEFSYNEEKTYNQPGADQGLAVDSLFDIKYPQLVFNIVNENTSPPPGSIGLPSNVTIRYHHGLVAPTNEAMDEFVSEYLAGSDRWGDLEHAPLFIKRMIANTHMSSNPIYPSYFTEGFLNGEKDLVSVNQADIVQKQYGSNCTFIGVNKVIVPRAFEGVTGPIYLERQYSTVMYAIERSGLLPALKRENQNYSLFIESDLNLGIDSFLRYTPGTQAFSAFQLSAPGQPAQRIALTINDLRTLILNHTALETPRGFANKEYIKNLAGNYLVFNNVTGEVSGTAPTYYGFHGSVEVQVIPSQIGPDAYNGKTFDISNWFSFSSTSLFVKISGSYPKFQALLKKAGLTKDKEYQYTFISDNKDYTIFVPSEAALDSYNSDTLTLDELKQFCMMHFVQGKMIFTDGNASAGYYETCRIDERSTPYSTIYTKMRLDPGYDVINIPDKTGGTYLTIGEGATSNIITGRNLGTGTEAIQNIISNGVIHEIDKVILFYEVDKE